MIITRHNERAVVMLSLEDYEALQETAYLLRSPKNARRLLESIAELQSDGGVELPLLTLAVAFDRIRGVESPAP